MIARLVSGVSTRSWVLIAALLAALLIAPRFANDYLLTVLILILYLAYVGQAKALATMVVDMLADGAAGAREVLGKAKRPLTRQGYLELQRSMARREVYEGR